MFSLTPLAGSSAHAADCPPCPPCEGEKKAEGSEVDPEEQEVDGEIELNKLENLYEPVAFTHEEHTEYADECTQCHHHQETGAFKPCDECHKQVLFREADKLNTPGLSGAYHRQCIGCHIEYDSDLTECTDCHEMKEKAPVKK